MFSHVSHHGADIHKFDSYLVDEVEEIKAHW